MLSLVRCGRSTRVVDRDRIIRLFGEYRSLLQGSFAKEAYNFKEPTNRSQWCRSYPRQQTTAVCCSLQACSWWVLHSAGLLMVGENIGLFCRALLQKRPMISRSLLIVVDRARDSRRQLGRLLLVAGLLMVGPALCRPADGGWWWIRWWLRLVGSLQY